MQLRNILTGVGFVFGGLLEGLFGWLFPCEHEQTVVTMSREETCCETGLSHLICLNCDDIIQENIIPVMGHSFSAYQIISKPGPNKDGVQVRVCVRCGQEESAPIICPHDNTIIEILSEASCCESGREKKTCEECFTEFERAIPPLHHGETASFVTRDASCSTPGVISSICTVCFETLETTDIPTQEHTYGDWLTGEYATPKTEGHKYRICSVCGHKDIENTSISLQDNTLYIPSMDLLCSFGVGEFTQAAVNANDVLYTEYAYRHHDPSNPFILGHNYGSLGKLYNLKVGAHVYVQLDGVIYDYKVVNSEYAVEYYGLAQVGQTTGVSIWDTYSGASHDDEECVLSGESTDRRNQNDGMTLHMYTCYYGQDKPEWESSHGRNGRWIVIADLVDKMDAIN